MKTLTKIAIACGVVLIPTAAWAASHMSDGSCCGWCPFC